MSTNTELAEIFSEMAALLELTGANVFRINAHENAARVLRELATDVRDLADDKKALTAIEGIGSGTADRIVEYVKSGSIHDHQQLLDEVPRGLIDVLKIPGLGPKTAKLMWEKAGVVDMTTLQRKLESGELEQLPRMGKKTIQNIRDSIEFMKKASERVRIGTALSVAEQIVEHLQQVRGVKEVQYAGSLRRGRETIGDIDILACTSNAEALSEAFRAMPGVERVLASGETKSSLRLEAGIQVDLRIVDEDSFGAALMYFTGSKEHNVALRERAIRKKMRLNEYGLFPADRTEEQGEDEPPQRRGIKPIASRTERDVYQALQLPYIPPELRENHGELERAIPDDLVELPDIKAELHAHTKASDGRLTIDELAEEAKARGFHTIAVTDHSRSSVQAGGLSDERLREHIKAVRVANDRIKGITILAGSEVDILVDGSLDYPDDLLAELDIVVASPHASLAQSPEKATQRLLAAISHPLVHIIGHPTGRVINRREGLHPDIAALIEAAIEHNTALELNANHLRLDLRDAHIRAASEAGALIAINTDAHGRTDFDQLRYGILTARRGWLTKAQCINAWSRQKLHAWLKKKR